MTADSTKKMTEHAGIFYEALEGLDCFQKQEVVVILSTLVELEVRRFMRSRKAD